MTDWIDKFLGVMSVFDYISPIANNLQGYNRSVLSTRDYQEAVAYSMKLDKQGIKSRVEGNPISGYMVLVK